GLSQGPPSVSIAERSKVRNIEPRWHTTAFAHSPLTSPPSRLSVTREATTRAKANRPASPPSAESAGRPCRPTYFKFPGRTAPYARANGVRREAACPAVAAQPTQGDARRRHQNSRRIARANRWAARPDNGPAASSTTNDTVP